MRLNSIKKTSIGQHKRLKHLEDAKETKEMIKVPSLHRPNEIVYSNLEKEEVFAETIEPNCKENLLLGDADHMDVEITVG